MHSHLTDEWEIAVLASDRDATVSDELPARVRHHPPVSVDDDQLSTADALVVVDRAGLDRIKGSYAGTPIVAFGSDPSNPVATDPIVDAVAADSGELSARIRWLFARRSREELRNESDAEPTRIERLHAGAARLATARSPGDAYRTTAAIADEVFSTRHSIVGVVDGEWIEPVAVSTDDDPADRNRIRVGDGIAGTAIESGEPIVDGSLDHESYGSALTVPVDDDVILQTVSTVPNAFDRQDLELAELLASHLEETLSRLRVDDRLRAERDRLFALFENIPDAAVAYDYVDGVPHVDRVNPAFEETFGYDAERIVGEPVDEYIIPPDDDDAFDKATELNAKLKHGDNVRREVTRRTADGDRHFILHVVPIQLGTENASGYAIYTDVTERREREATLRRQNDRLDEFASIVSHDIRNPLSIARGHLDLARSTGESDHLDRVDDALDRMDELVTDLLSLARDGHLVGEQRELHLADVAREAWANVETGEATLVVDDGVAFEADPTRVRELFENLFHNSVEHGSTDSSRRIDGGGKGDAVESVELGENVVAAENADPTDNADAGVGMDGRPDRSAPLTVRVGALDRDAEESKNGAADASSGTSRPPGFYLEDDGFGFDDAAMDRIFDSGYTTGSEGTGLGLAICERIAEAHGWTVRAVAAEPAGARFEFRFGSADPDGP